MEGRGPLYVRLGADDCILLCHRWSSPALPPVRRAQRAINPDKNRPAAPDQSHKFRESVSWTLRVELWWMASYARFPVAQKVHGHFVDRYRAFQWSKGYAVRFFDSV